MTWTARFQSWSRKTWNLGLGLQTKVGFWTWFWYGGMFIYNHIYIYTCTILGNICEIMWTELDRYVRDIFHIQCRWEALRWCYLCPWQRWHAANWRHEPRTGREVTNPYQFTYSASTCFEETISGTIPTFSSTSRPLHPQGAWDCFAHGRPGKRKGRLVCKSACMVQTPTAHPLDVLIQVLHWARSRSDFEVGGLVISI
jgi:hypothetical protein